MRKGITPIISIIVLLLITVALAGVAWTYLSGYMETYTKGAFTITTGGVYCSTDGIHVLVNNPTTSPILESDFITKTATGDTGTHTLDLQVNGADATQIDAKGHGDFVTNCGGTCSGSYTIDIGTTASIQHLSVSC